MEECIRKGPTFQKDSMGNLWKKASKELQGQPEALLQNVKREGTCHKKRYRSEDKYSCISGRSNGKMGLIFKGIIGRRSRRRRHGETQTIPAIF